MKEFYQPQVKLGSLVSFIIDNHAAMAKWDRRTLVYWIQFHVEQGFLIPISSDGLTLDGIVIARPIMHPRDAFDHFKYDHEGPLIYVELAISKTKEGLRALTIALVHRFGSRQSACWHRSKRPTELIVVPAGRVVNKLLKKAPA